MNTGGYQWRHLPPKERERVLEERKENKLPWHRPPHFESERSSRYLITAACYEHAPVIGISEERMSTFERILLETTSDHGEVEAWVILPNHYHFLVESSPLKPLLAALGKLHGRSSFDWNRQDGQRGRKVFHGLTERVLRSDRHYQATLNYIHHNPVKHGYVENWQDWPYSSVHRFFESEGREAMVERWRAYPIGEYGAKWDHG